MDTVIISSILSIGGMGLLFGAGLAFASKKFAIEVDPKIEEIIDNLPGANCGACGYPGCSGYAEAIAKSGAEVAIDLCTPGGAAVSAKIAEIMGISAVEAKEPQVAVVQCRGNHEKAPKRFHYHGITDCAAAELIMKGDKGCVYGCLGLGTCVESCPFGAMIMGSDGLPIVLEDKCTACGVCVAACPRGIMALIPRSQKIFLGCVSQDKAKKVKEVCSVGCIGCSLCSKPKVTPSGSIEMNGNLPKIVNPTADDLPMAVEKCPTNSFVVRK
ncbi:RnfABCDGE type electron transport complex subunit B [candidate division KSB1 bacterium]|nr:RnfABCDGE type electron transport complex subunit B [candidate division KSB1 bacterium]